MGKRRYKVSIDWCGFEGDRAVLPICVRSAAVQGRKFEETLKIMRPKIRHLHVMICDSLDRYNLEHLTDDPYKESLIRANDWLETHLSMIEDYFPSHDVTHWNTISAHPSFKGTLRKIYELYENSEEVRTLIDGMSDFYLVQKERRFYEQGCFIFNAQEERRRSTAYLLEEMAGNIVAYHEFFDGAPEIYWGLYISDPTIFSRAAGPDEQMSLTFPMTCPIQINLLPPPVPTSELYTDDKTSPYISGTQIERKRA